MAILYVALLAALPLRAVAAPARHRAPPVARARWSRTLLLVAVSIGLSQWVERVANYELFYGAFGSVVVVLLWFYLSTISLVLGGFINAELERHAGAPGPGPLDVLSKKNQPGNHFPGWPAILDVQAHHPPRRNLEAR